MIQQLSEDTDLPDAVLAHDVGAEDKSLFEGAKAAGGSMMAMRLATSGLQFDIQTAVDSNAQIIALTARLELTTEMLAETNRRLEEANMRIGRLENELKNRPQPQVGL